VREKGTKKAKVVLCDKGGYTALQLQCEYNYCPYEDNPVHFTKSPPERNPQTPTYNDITARSQPKPNHPPPISTSMCHTTQSTNHHDHHHQKPQTVANRDDIKAMSSDGARLITAASDGDKKAVKNFLKNGVDVNSRCVRFFCDFLVMCVCVLFFFF
jgi:hypothetical protein